MRDDRSPRTSLRARASALRDMSPSARRRLAVRSFMVGLAVIAVVIVPGYVSSRPQFMERYGGVEAEYATWSASVHAKTSCQACHVPPSVVPQTAYAARMLGEYYLSFAVPGREPKLLRQPTDAACLRCHMDLRTVSPSGDLNIPHRAHVTILKMRCVECHANLVHSAGDGGKNTPPMAGCLKCHDGVTAKNECSACHTEKAEPLTHREPTWLIQHAEKADEKCNACHKWKKDWCADCHQSKRPRSHNKEWRAQHGESVEKRRNCEACHEPAFCIRCHGEVPSLNFDPAWKPVRQAP